VRFGVEDRDAPAGVSSGGAEGDRIAARECGDGIMAVGGLLRPAALWENGCGRKCGGDVV